MVAFAANAENTFKTMPRARGQYRNCLSSPSRCSKSNENSTLRESTYGEGVGLVTCTRDPIGYEGSERNLYSYCSPALGLDPNGLKFVVNPIPRVGFDDLECEDICIAAALNPKVRSDGGSVICGCQETCDGDKECKMCACVFGFPKHNVLPGDCPALDADILEHENKHLKDPSRCDELGISPARPVGSGLLSECAHRKASAANLRRALQTETNIKCGIVMGIVAVEVEDWIRQNCP